MQIGGVENVYIGAQFAPQRRRQGVLVGDSGDAGEGRRKGRAASRLDGALVHVGVVVVGDLARL